MMLFARRRRMLRSGREAYMRTGTKGEKALLSANIRDRAASDSATFRECVHIYEGLQIKGMEDIREFHQRAIKTLNEVEELSSGRHVDAPGTQPQGDGTS